MVIRPMPERGGRRTLRSMRTRIPLNLFAIPFGLCGLAGCWQVAAAHGLAPVSVGGGLLVVAAAAWVAVLAAYLRGLRPLGATLRQDLTDRTAGPFASLIVLTPMLIAAEGVHPLAPAAGQVLVDVFLVLTLLLGAWITGDWIVGPVERDRIHPGWFLPTVAGGFVAAAAAATVGQPGVAMGLFGLGLLCWAMLGPVVLARLIVGPMLPVPLRPTLAIEVAPAAVASLAWFAMNGDRVDAVAWVLGGFGLLMVLVQLRLLPLYLRLRFMPSTWAFVFSWTAVASAGLHWLAALAPPGRVVYEYVLLAAISTPVAGLAARTVVAVVQRRLLPTGPASTREPDPVTVP
jgi:tellurite resistance protein